MEDINNNVNNELVTPVIETPTKENNTFKVLFIISILVVIGLLVVIYFLLQNSKELNVTKTNNEVEETVVPTNEPTITTEKSKTYEAVSVQDDTHSISKLVLKDSKGNETVVDESEYWKLGETDTIIKPSYSNFVFSPNNNFLSYMKGEYEGGQSFLYDIKNKQKIDQLGFYIYSTGFTPDSKYFYGCSEHGIMNGGAIIIDLIKSTLIYKKEGSFNCKYNANDNSLSLTEEFLISGEKKTTLFSFTKGDFMN